MDSGIYCFENLINGKKYIGKSINVKKRIAWHLSNLKKNKDDSVYLQRAWNKYGEENFLISILETCPIESIEDREIYYISELGTKSPNGYNLTKGGDGSLGYKHTPESIKKIKNRFYPKGEQHHFFGKHHTEKTKTKLGEIHKGKSYVKGIKRTKEQLIKLSVARQGRGTKNKRKNTSSIYFGVYYSARDRRWITNISINKKTIVIGRYKEEYKAGLAWDKYVIENNLDRKLNFPEKIDT